VRAYTSISHAGCCIASLALAGSGCGVVGPSCTEEDVIILNARGLAAADGTVTYTVVSPRSSNLLIRLTWPDTAATLGLRATIIACGGHVGCRMDTFVPPFGPGGPSPIPQPWPPGLREILVDGWKGKTYVVEITGDSRRDASFTLEVTYQIRCES
jgi:hypothetical protein